MPVPAGAWLYSHKTGRIEVSEITDTKTTSMLIEDVRELLDDGVFYLATAKAHSALTDIQSRITELEAGQQAAIDGALQSVIDAMPVGSIHACDTIRSRIGTNPLAELQAENAELRAALNTVKDRVCGEIIPYWKDMDYVYGSRIYIAEVCDIALSQRAEQENEG